MDGIRSKTTKPIHDVTDNNLPAVTASLANLSVDTSLSGSPGSKRTLRKRVTKRVTNEELNRRCSLKPKKRTSSEMETEDHIREYYLDKNLKKESNKLETIYEEGKDSLTENLMCMSRKRYKRTLEFVDGSTDAKLKKRRAKIRKVFGSKVNLKRRYMPMEILLEKLKDIRGESPAKTDTEVK